VSQRALVELIRGHGAHTDCVECFRGLTPELAGRRQEGFPYTVWQLLGHVNYWIEYEMARVSGAAPEYPEHARLSWPERPAPRDAAEWEQAVARFEHLLDQMSRLAGSPDAVLQGPVPTTHASQEGKDATLLGVLWQTVVHNSYHLGQVATLRRALGAWPPPGGSDTW
jgi:uncharacterized damage-inducible protein DinB